MLLINKGLTVNEVITVKLTSGEELIAKLVEDNVSTFVLARPMVLTMGNQGIGMTPFLFTVGQNTDVPINKSAIVCALGSDKEMADAYLSGTSGIVLA